MILTVIIRIYIDIIDHGGQGQGEVFSSAGFGAHDCRLLLAVVLQS